MLRTCSEIRFEQATAKYLSYQGVELACRQAYFFKSYNPLRDSTDNNLSKLAYIFFSFVRKPNIDWTVKMTKSVKAEKTDEVVKVIENFQNDPIQPKLCQNYFFRFLF